MRKEMEPRIESWLSGFSEEEQKLMLDLLSNFHYYSEKRMNEKVEELYKEFVESYTGNPADVIFTKIIKEQGASFSDIFSSAFWFQNNLYDYMEPNILSLLEEGSVPGTLVIVDDYSGTGKTFIKTIDKFIEKNRNIITTSLYFLTLHITQRAIKQIEEYSKEIGVQIKIISLEISDEAFKSGYLFEEGQASVYKGYKQDKIEMRGDRAETSDFPLYLNTVAGGLDCRNQTIGGFPFVVKINTVPVIKIIG